MAGQDTPRLYGTPDDPDRDFDGALPDPAFLEEAWRHWEAEVAFAEHFTADAAELGMIGTTRDGEQVSLREVL